MCSRSLHPIFWFVSILVVFISSNHLGAQEPAVKGIGTSSAPASSAGAPRKGEPAAKSNTEGPGKDGSLAERIARLESIRDDNQSLIKTLTQKLVQLQKEYDEANREFKRVNDQFEERKKAYQTAQESGDATGAEKIQATIAELEKKWKLARERFDLAIEARNTAREQIQGIEEKNKQDGKALEKLTNPADPSPAASPDPPHSKEPSPVRAEVAPPVSMNVLAQAPAGLPGVAPAAGESPPGGADKEKGGAETSKAAEAPVNKKLKKAQLEAAQKEVEAERAVKEVEDVAERLQILKKSIARDKVLLENARKRVGNEEETLKTYQEDLRKLQEQRAAPSAVQEAYRKIREVQQRLAGARTEVQEVTGRLQAFREQQEELLSAKKTAEQKAQKSAVEAADARQSVASIQNPFSPQNLLLWIEQRGPKLLFILIVVLVVQVLIKQIAKRIVVFLSRSISAETAREREKRANTLVGVFRNTSIVVLYAWAVLMTLEIIGIPIAPLLGGVAVIGLAVAFASQNLIKDYFYGFMILLENQYGVNDVVSVAGITGFVERITLRMTVIRNYDAVHFIPHGQITTVSNLTHKWSRAVFDIGVAYKENVDRVMEVLMQLGREMRQDPEFSRDILADPEMLGVDAFGDSAVVIKFLINTKPIRQWAVKRELLRRIKNKFDELGIEIPFPHRTVYHRCEEGEAIAVRQAEPTAGVGKAS
ncbi:MAG: mechanosensitive ion channel [Pirellulales bacterium]|nr:mechanosensitive ion channel [Pirellulales bacterium]